MRTKAYIIDGTMILYLGKDLKNNRISTTISSKHWAMLLKLAEEHGTQQKALELAIENLDSGPRSMHKPSLEEDAYTRVSTELKSICLLPREALKLLLDTADLDMVRCYIDEQTPLEWTLEYNYQKPLKEFTLREVVDGIIFFGKMAHWFDTGTYTDDGEHYSLRISHSTGVNGSKVNQMLIESVFRKYGVETDSTISERSIFMKAFKKD
jgi:hypothetical protein